MAYNTQNRQLILEYIKQDKYISVNDIHQELLHQGRKISVSTIYRFLDYLEKERLIIRHIDPSTKRACFAYVGDNHMCQQHLHMKCRECGLTVHLPAELLSQTEELHQFKVEYDSSIIQGTCNICL